MADAAKKESDKKDKKGKAKEAEVKKGAKRSPSKPKHSTTPDESWEEVNMPKS